MKPFSSPESDSRPCDGIYVVRDSARQSLRSQSFRRRANNRRWPVLLSRNGLPTKRTEKRNRALLSITSAVISLSSSLVVGPLLTSSARWSVAQAIGPHSSHRHIVQTGPSIQPDPYPIPPIPRLTGMFHIFCLSSLVLYRSRKTDPYQTAIIILVALLGIGIVQGLFFMDPCMDIIGKVISILPCLLSLGAIFSAILHTILPSFHIGMSELHEQDGIKSNIGVSIGSLPTSQQSDNDELDVMSA
ncbi:hypothetical protein F4803DRAFT_534906 [Xylaria telfairii]|nr:hypothetical protein F4803DRAFT_534906 [Xylaria telfairii]